MKPKFIKFVLSMILQILPAKAKTANTIMLKNNLNCPQVRDPDRETTFQVVQWPYRRFSIWWDRNVGFIDIRDHFVAFSDGETTSWSQDHSKVIPRNKPLKISKWKNSKPIVKLGIFSKFFFSIKDKYFKQIL